MAKPGKGKLLLSVTCPEEYVELIDERRKPLGWSRSQYALKIIEQWIQAGSPPVTKHERAFKLVYEGKASK